MEAGIHQLTFARSGLTLREASPGRGVWDFEREGSILRCIDQALVTTST